MIAIPPGMTLATAEAQVAWFFDNGFPEALSPIGHAIHEAAMARQREMAAAVMAGHHEQQARALQMAGFAGGRSALGGMPKV